MSPTDDLIDGHTLDDLADYLDHDERPRDKSIDDSPDCQIALAGLKRLRRVSDTLLDDDAKTEPARDDSWIAAILENLRIEAHAGRSIPVRHSAATANLVVTEGAVREIIRRAGDDVGGVLIGRTKLDGDVTIPDEPIRVDVQATIFWGENIPELAPLIRASIIRDLRHHTELNIAAVDVTITDVEPPQKEQQP